MNVKPVQLGELLKDFGDYLSVSDITAAKLLAKISETIVKKRIDMEMTQKEFAKHLNVSQSMVSKWESENYNFSIETLALVCEKLGLKLDIEMKSNTSQYKDFLKKSINKSSSGLWGCLEQKNISDLDKVAV